MEPYEANGANEALLHEAKKTVEVLTRENEALRTVLARLHRENIRLSESLLRATSDAKRKEEVAASTVDETSDRIAGGQNERV